MEFITLILTPVVESLYAPVKRHLGFLVSSSSMVTDMNAKVRELENAERDMRSRQDFNIENSRVVPHGVPGWLVEVEEIKASKEKISTGGVGCFNIKAKYIAGKKSSKILKEINRLMNEKTAMEWTGQIIPLGTVSPPRPSTSEAVHEEDQNQKEYRIKSRYLIFKKALNFLEPNNNVTTQMMALCGMGGVGKTTMMEELKKVAAEKKMFDYIVKVEVGKNPNPISIQQIVAEFLGEALTKTSRDTRAERLKKRIENISKEGKKKILVILDDVWEKFNLGEIGLASPLPNGVKLLLTSRDENVCNQMGVETCLIFKIVVLLEEEARTLFWGLIGQGSDTDPKPNMQQIGEDILKRCGGLPIAISAIASTLKVNKKKHAWNDVLNRLQKKLFYGLDLRAIFEISYMNLKEDDLKAIFVLSGLFPEDYNIDKEDLLRYGWGLNFFKEMHTIATARDRVHTCVDTLVGLNLLIKSDHEECIKIHDLVRDFVLSNFSEVNQASIVSHNNSISEQLRKEVSYERIVLKCGDKFELCEDFNQPNLALLTLMDGELLKFSQDIFTNMEKLEVVAYKKMDLQFLPQYTTNLRVLSLQSCTLSGKDISFLGNLINLEVLGLTYCGIRSLPSKLGKLKRLRILDLTGCDDSLCIDEGVIKNLDKLEELYMEVSGKIAIRFTDANCNELKMILNKLSALEVEFLETAQLTDVSFEKLERFRIATGCLFGKYQGDWGCRNNYSLNNTLKLVTSVSVLIAWKLSELFRKTEMLHLEVKDMSCLEDILTNPPHITFCNLKELSIYGCGGLTYLFTIPVAKSLTKLESLKIRSCGALRSLVYGENNEAGVITFPKLKNMDLSKLQELVSLCGPTKVIMELPQLVNLQLDELTGVTSIFPMMELHLDGVTTCCLEDILTHHPHISFCNLKELSIYGCGGLAYLFTVCVAKGLVKLESLVVSSCDVLKSMVNGENSEDGLITFNKLTKLELYGLPNITSIFPEDGNNISSKQPFLNNKVVFPKLEKLSICSMEKLKEVWPCEITSSEEEEVNNISMLRDITVKNCDSLENLFPSNPMKLLNHLEELEVEYCDSIEVLFNIEVGKVKRLSSISNLRKIEARELKKLREVWRIKDAKNNYYGLPIPGFQSVRYLNIIGCERFTKIVSPTTANFYLRELMEIRIYGCGGYSETKNELIAGRQVQEIDNVSKEEISKLAKNMFVFPSRYISPDFHHLRNINLSRSPGVEVVFEMESLSNRDQLVINEQQPLPLFPYLEDLDLSNLNTFDSCVEVQQLERILYSSQTPTTILIPKPQKHILV